MSWEMTVQETAGVTAGIHPATEGWKSLFSGRVSAGGEGLIFLTHYF